jgi:FtsZ-binding cell division protein ZapB
MAGEIAYKLTADEKQAVDALVKLAKGFADTEARAKGLSDETKKAQQEQAELGRIAKRAMDDAQTPADRYRETMEKLDKALQQGLLSQDA